ncbi:hypothetical protein M407DRAFT_246125 [Tulasnella calospora MUT 4182]|uniref:Uncharacterized protein n=1 Tax=Tulasnella calospora MUT 4182 TaxID=1051891 RepID=A0A0C3KDR3_9AGAM|nr:hypothetical protein M407DRAFT_246125 [Tulasnella calospora MUT 4182]
MSIVYLKGECVAANQLIRERDLRPSLPKSRNPIDLHTAHPKTEVAGKIEQPLFHEDFKFD